MAGYRDKSEIFGEQHKPTRIEWVVIGVALVAGFAMMVGAIAHGMGGGSWLKALDFGSAPIGLVQFMLGYTFLVRARVNGAGERYSPRALRACALLFFLLGALIVGIGIYSHFQGAR